MFPEIFKLDNMVVLFNIVVLETYKFELIDKFFNIFNEDVIVVSFKTYKEAKILVLPKNIILSNIFNEPNMVVSPFIKVGPDEYK